MEERILKCTDRSWLFIFLSPIFLLSVSAGLLWAEPPLVGPETEKRFPSLKMPQGFQATLFACDPLIEYPSAIARAPDARSLFVAIDFMTGLGTEIIRRDEIRLIQDTDGDGYADKATVYATGFNSIEGMTYHAGAVYAMHSPLLTVLTDTDGDGIADERRDLVSGLGLPPEENPPRLHCANGVVAGHDGWLYLALGDHGCNVLRPEGDRLVFEGGGILRCRPDGHDLHVFATGLRNIYDVAVDDELNVFVRDNENDGGDYKIRVCHSFFGADHGYPYLYYERPEEAVPPLADLGLGSSAGGLAYLETQLPPEYRGNLFFCEWGRAVMRYRPERAASGFAPIREIEFAAGAENDPYGFKPTDLAVARDGSLVVADWADGQRPKRGRARIYQIRFVGESRSAAIDAAQRQSKVARSSDVARDELENPSYDARTSIAQLDADGYYDRLEAQLAIEHRGREAIAAVHEALSAGKIGTHGRLHVVWILAGLGDSTCVEALFRIAANDPEPRVRAQAVRALADLSDPILTQHRLDAQAGDSQRALRLADLATEKNSRVLLDVIVALGRLRWADAPQWMANRSDLRQADALKKDATLSHAVMQTLRRSSNWPELLNMLDSPSDDPLRSVALQAIAGQFAPELVDGLVERLHNDADAARRIQYADALARVHRKPGPWVYWGYRPAPRPANTVAWDRTTAIEQALDQSLSDMDSNVRLAVLRRMQREKIPTRLETLSGWLTNERDAERVTAILQSLGDQPVDVVRADLANVVRSGNYALTNRLAALDMWQRGIGQEASVELLEITKSVEDGPVLAQALRLVVRHAREAHVRLSTAANLSQVDLGRLNGFVSNVAELLLNKLNSTDGLVRAAAVEGAGELSVRKASDAVRKLLADEDLAVQRAAARTSGALRLESAAETLLNLARHPDSGIRRASLESLHSIGDRRVLPAAIAALNDRDTQVVALDCLRDLGGAEHAKILAELAKRYPSNEVLPRVLQSLTKWSENAANDTALRVDLDRMVAEVQATSGVLGRWKTIGPLNKNKSNALISQLTANPSDTIPPPIPHQNTVLAIGPDARIKLETSQRSREESLWVAYTDLAVGAPVNVQFLGSCNGLWRIWLNDQLVYQRKEPSAFRIDSDSVEVTMGAGPSRLIVEVTVPEGEAQFHLRVRPKTSTAERERLVQAALSRTGNAERGRTLFVNAEKSQCLKCHRLGEVGERIGPELTGVGGRFSRVHIIESILEPSRTIAPSFESIAVILKDGRSLSGIRIAETDTQLTLADTQAQKQAIPKSEIEEQRPQPQSIMPDGLEKRLTADEFVDLLAYLLNQK